MDAPSFIFRDTPSFHWPVTVRQPQDGAMVAMSFEAEFIALPEDALFASDDGPLAEMPQAEAIIALIERDRARLREVLIGWRGIVDEAGEPLAFSPANRDRLLAHRAVRTGIGEAYAEAMLGQREARAGN